MRFLRPWLALTVEVYQELRWPARRRGREGPGGARGTAGRWRGRDGDGGDRGTAGHRLEAAEEALTEQQTALHGRNTTIHIFKHFVADL